ncbi:zinc finger and BTB domain-containing protein 41-like [Chironomus tepperi]|uniref:zinc finger and BTB domain-containing protein 41-like n=1 Tax=Chironomus tepperi TaxID=113505 RepID=UPI00391F584D
MTETLVELVNCCRCCLRGFGPEEIAVAVDESLRNSFYEITGTELAYEPEVYSDIVCDYCNNKINEFVTFKNELLESQRTLQEIRDGFIEVLVDDVDVETKPEVMEIVENYESEKIECIIDNSNNEIIKSEAVTYYENVHITEPKTRHGKDCYICGLSFSGMSGYYNHMRRAHFIGKQYYCDICGKICNIKNDLIIHMRKHMSKDSREKFSCPICETSVLSKSALNNHLKTFHSDVIEIHPCDYPNCEKSFQTRTKLLQHRKTVHETGKFPCDYCEKCFTTKQYLQKHFKQCHSVKIMENCEICGKEFPKGIQLKRHMQIHEEKQQCYYENCDKVFQFKTSLLNHIKFHHSRTDSSVSCDQCGLNFPTIKHLNRHVSRQHNDVKVACEVDGCTHLFGRKDYLASHYKTHRELDEETRKGLIDKVKHIKVIPW